MAYRLTVLLLVISVGLTLFIIELVRRRRLKEKYSVIWLVMGIMITAMIIWPRFGIALKSLCGIEVLSNMVFLAAMLFIVVMCIHFSVCISMLTEQTKTLAQEIALIKEAGRRTREG